ncbi:MAG: ATP-grasp domain-containing protein [Clostridia bacterium]|nr:ATP-grasp domain-containing protein [Clostridia bacterium]
MSQRILLLYNSVPTEIKKDNTILWECVSPLTVAAIYEALQQTGSEIIPVNLLSPKQLEETVSEQGPITLAFVIAEGFLEIPETLYNGFGAMAVREALMGLGIPSTHSCPEVMKVCRNKNLTYHVLRNAGIPVPDFFVIEFESGRSVEEQVEKLEEVLSYPLFVKPVGGGNSICIDKQSIVENREDLYDRIEILRAVLGDYPVLVETFLPGREYTVGVMGNGDCYVLPIVGFPTDTVVRSAQSKISPYAARKMDILDVRNSKCSELVDIAYRSFKTIGARDLVRIDIKEDSSGKCHVIDFNGTPSLSSTSSVVAMAEAVGIKYPELIGILLYEALKRAGIEPTAQLIELVSEPIAKLRAFHKEMVA